MATQRNYGAPRAPSLPAWLIAATRIAAEFEAARRAVATTIALNTGV